MDIFWDKDYSLDLPTTDLSKWDARGLELAKLVAGWSRDPSTKTGAVIMDTKHRIVSVGFNGFPRGVLDDDRYLDRLQKLEIIIHAEVNAILFAEKMDLSECTLYVYPLAPCSHCAAIMIQSGLKRVMAPVSDNERWRISLALTRQLLDEAGVELIEID